MARPVATPCGRPVAWRESNSRNWNSTPHSSWVMGLHSVFCWIRGFLHCVFVCYVRRLPLLYLLQDVEQSREYSTWSAAIDFRWQADRRWSNLVWLQHPEGIYPLVGGFGVASILAFLLECLSSFLRLNPPSSPPLSFFIFKSYIFSWKEHVMKVRLSWI